MPKQRLSTYTFFLLLFLCSSSAVCEIHKWKDKEGNIHYGDKPPELNQQNQVEITNLKSVKMDSRTKAHANSQNNFSNSLVLHVRELFKQKKFDLISNELDIIQKRVNSDILLEEWLLNVYLAFDLKDTSYQSYFDNWIEVRPNEYHAYVARAQYYFSLAWHSRGGKWASETSNKQMANMKLYFRKAKVDLLRAIDINRQGIVPYTHLMGIATATGSEKETNRILQRTLTIAPNSYLIRKAYILSLLPRWGGSVDKMQAFAENSMIVFAKNKKVKLLQGFISIESGDQAFRKKDYSNALYYYSHALKFGENYRAYVSLGKTNYKMGKYKQAKANLSKAIAMKPDDSSFYHWRSLVYSKLAEHQQAFSDIKKAERLDPKEPRIIRRVNKLTSQIKVPGVGFDKSLKLDIQIQELGQKIKENPEQSAYYFNRAVLLLKRSDFVKAQTDLIKAISIKPDKFEYYRVLDMVLFKQNKLSEILIYWQQYMKIVPDDNKAYMERAGTHYHMQNFKLALKDARKSMDMGNTKAKAFYSKLQKIVHRQAETAVQ